MATPNRAAPPPATTNSQPPASSTTPSATPLLDAALEKTAANLDAIASQYRREVDDGLVGVRRSLATSATIAAMERALDDKTMASFIRLMNTELGFKTDRGEGTDKPAYDVTVVRRVLIAGFLKGAYPIGNEINIIAGGLMLVKNYYVRAIREWPGVSGDPVYGGEVTGPNRVRAWAWCIRDGKRVKVEQTFSVTAFKNAVDAMIGKGERRILMALLRELGGRADDEDGVEEATPAPAKTTHMPAEPPTRREEPAQDDQILKLFNLYKAAEAVGVITKEEWSDHLARFGVTKGKDLPPSAVRTLTMMLQAAVENKAFDKATASASPAPTEADPDADLEPEPGSMFPPPVGARTAAMEDRR